VSVVAVVAAVVVAAAASADVAVDISNPFYFYEINTRKYEIYKMNRCQ
jgi:hypothetical protein